MTKLFNFFKKKKEYNYTKIFKESSNKIKNDWEELGICYYPKEWFDDEMYYIMSEYPGNNISQFRGEYLVRGVWTPPEEWDGENVRTDFYYWIRKKATKKDWDDMRKQRPNEVSWEEYLKTI